METLSKQKKHPLKKYNKQSYEREKYKSYQQIHESTKKLKKHKRTNT